MLNYEAAVTCDAGLEVPPLCLVGRGMGALAVLLAARRVLPAAIALVEPWPPEVPSAEATRPESPLALEECRRGLSVPRPDAPLLVVESAADPYAVSAWARSASARAM